MQRLLIANRGEIAIRIARAAADLGVASLAAYAPEDAASLHRLQADEAVALEGRGAAAYLDIEQLVALATAHGCDAVHPGYGFLSENAQFAERLEAAGITFVGPDSATLAALGDKSEARTLAAQCGIPLLRGSDGPATLDEAHAFFKALDGAPLIIKAVSGGGGRGMRVVEDAKALDAAYSRCASEAELAFGDPALYLEEYLPGARHVEVQILGDGSGAVSHLWERECSIQRRRQKIVEIAPCPNMDEALRSDLSDAALRLGQAVNYRSAGTVEFLVSAGRSATGLAFIEANARLQVEHTVTEEVTGIDLVRAQLQIADGATLAELGLQQASIPVPQGFAIQARINMETLGEDGSIKPAGGTLNLFELPTGPGLRTDSFGY
ncbi:MAG: carbamoyl-phosphate synthase large subunit, partial [Gammaproteobacteria bacterium]|nr:carbamoyl-phosphate synthase large subunit [Gammaproteobacteria bacterium]